MTAVLDMMKKYPLLSSWNVHTRWSGFVEINDELLRLTIKLPNYPLLSGGELLGDAQTLSLLQPFKSKIKDLLRESFDLVTFLDAIVKLLSNNGSVSSRTLSTDRVNDKFYEVLMRELEELGLDNVLYLADDFREIHTKIMSDRDREHIVKYYLQSKYPNVSLKVNLEVPSIQENVVWPNRIVEANRQITQLVKKFNAFWDEMELLDSTFHIVDPLKPNRSHTHRRLRVTNKVSIHMEVNPLMPKAFPEITLMGPEKQTQDFEITLEKNWKKWDGDASLVQNLETLFETEFLPKSDESIMNQTDESRNCIVCLNFEFDGHTPERMCDCGAQYHNMCLYELYLNEFCTNLKRAVDCAVCGVELKILAPVE